LGRRTGIVEKRYAAPVGIATTAAFDAGIVKKRSTCSKHRQSNNLPGHARQVQPPSAPAAALGGRCPASLPMMRATKVCDVPGIHAGDLSASAEGAFHTDGLKSTEGEDYLEFYRSLGFAFFDN
jgi:hypothetical protein